MSDGDQEKKAVKYYEDLVNETAIVYTNYCKNISETAKKEEISELCSNFILLCAEEVREKMQKEYPNAQITIDYEKIIMIRGHIRKKAKELESKVIEVTG